MNINRSNIVQTIPKILEKIRGADFIAFDFEITGINRSELLRNNGFDTIQQRYWKSKENSSLFSPIQLGLCTFKLHSTKKIEASPFNIYLSQYTENGKSDKMYLYSSSAFNFLSHHNMNFNEVFKNGVFYFSKQQQEQFESYKNLQEIKNDIRKQIGTSLGYHLKEFLSLNEKTIELFMSNKRRKKLEFNLSDARYPSFFKEFESYIEKKYPQINIHITYDQDKALSRKKIMIQKLTEEKKKELQNEKELSKASSSVIYEEYESLNYNLRSIIDEIILLKKPLICHNGFIDVLQLYDKFLYDLPEGSTEFKRELNKYFPTIFDTKLIINASQKLSQEVNNQSDLRNCFEKLLKYKDLDTQIIISEDKEIIQNTPEIQTEDNNKIEENEATKLFSNYQINGLKETNKSHEGGYDALMTGYIFLKSLQLLNILPSYGTPMYAPQVDYFSNRLFLSSLQQSFDIKEIDISDTKQVEVFYVKQLNSFVPETIKLQEFFNNQLGSCKIYTIGNSLEQEYFVTTNDKNKFKYFEQKLNTEFNGVDVFTHDSKYFQIKTYQKYTSDLQKIVKEDKIMKIKTMDGVLDTLN